MSIRIPNLKAIKCPLFIACGVVETKTATTIAWLRKKRDVVARAKVEGNPCLFRLLTGNGPAKHLHIDIVDPDRFQKKSPPRSTATIASLQESLEPVMGEKVKANAEATFFVPVTELPPMIQSTLNPTVVGRTTIKMTGATLSVEGAPINVIRWRMRDDRKEAMIVLEGTQLVEFNEEYLETLLAPLKMAFNGLIQGAANVRE